MRSFPAPPKIIDMSGDIAFEKEWRPIIPPAVKQARAEKERLRVEAAYKGMTMDSSNIVKPPD